MPKIIMMHGLPATGKSTIAKVLVKEIPNSIVIKSATKRPIKHDPSYFDEAEVKEQKDAAYLSIIKDAEKVLKEGKTPILDGTFHKKHRRQWVYDLAKQAKVPIVMISTSCSENTSLERIQKRAGSNPDEILQTPEAYKLMAQQQDPIQNEQKVLRINTDDELKIPEVLKWLNTLL